MPIDFLPAWDATSIVVPVPQNGSSTTPSRGQDAAIGIHGVDAVKAGGLKRNPAERRL